jgi:hypothetical protein
LTLTVSVRLPWTSNSPDQHSTEESGHAAQHETDDREQRASKQEPIPPASPHAPCEPHDTDDCEQRSSSKPPADPPGACEPGAAPISGPIGWGGRGTPHHKVPAMRPHSHGRLLRRRWHHLVSPGVYANVPRGGYVHRRPPARHQEPRALRAWPPAWPMPSGSLGRQRLRGQGRVLKIVSAKRLETIFGCP